MAESRRPPVTAINIPKRPTSNASGTAEQRQSKQLVCEGMVENQRGALISGVSVFSQQALLPTDFPEYSDEKGGIVAGMRLLQCPKGWHWTSEWMVDKNGDVDVDGWRYATEFRSDKWLGRVKPTHYVRMRKWIRMRRAKGVESVTSATMESPMDESVDNKAMSLMQMARIDRDVLKELQAHLGTSSAISEPLVSLAMSLLKHECSKLKAALMIGPRLNNQQIAIAVLTQLKFYSDKLQFLRSTGLARELYPQMLTTCL